MFLLTYMSLNNINFRQLSLGERIINRLEELKMTQEVSSETRYGYWKTGTDITITQIQFLYGVL